MEWKPIPTFPSYEASTTGQIRRAETGHILAQNLTGTQSRYLCSCLWVDNKNSTQRVHRMVLMTFVGPPPEDKPFACHLDGDKFNNHLDNLYWGSQSDNMRDCIRHGTHKTPFVPGHKMGGRPKRTQHGNSPKQRP